MYFHEKPTVSDNEWQDKITAQSLRLTCFCFWFWNLLTCREKLESNLQLFVGLDLLKSKCIKTPS